MTKFIDNIIKGIKGKYSKENNKSLYGISLLYEKYLKHLPNKKYHNYKFNKKYLIKFQNPQAFLFSMIEIFKENIYFFEANNEKPLIIDCGSYIGTSILFFKIHYPDSRIISFEPDEENFKILSDNIQNWKFENIELKKAAVWKENGEILFNSIGDMSGNISNNENEPKLLKLKSIRLKDYLNQKIDFLKIDIEGAEFDVLMDCKENLKNVSNLFIEYHGKFLDGSKLIEIFKMIETAGFQFYIKEAANVFPNPFYRIPRNYAYDVQLNIFAFRN